jgi:transposase
MKSGRKGKAGRSESRPVRTRRTFTPEFKLEAVRLASMDGRHVSDVARELGLNAEMVRQWKRQTEARAGQDGSDVFPGHGKLTSQDEEIRRLRRENAVLREEREILKKATVFFAKDTR